MSETTREQEQGVLDKTEKNQPQEPEPSRDAPVSRRKVPVRLMREVDGVVVAVACGTCGRVYALNDGFAERCCDPRCADCGAELPLRGGWACCAPCLEKRNARSEAERQAKAIRVTEADYDGPVFHDGAWNEGYLRDVDELREWAECKGVEMPAAVWACTSKPLHLASASQLCEDMTQDSFEDAYDHLVGIEELQVAIDAFNAKQTAEEWEVDYSLLVTLTPEPADAIR